MTLAPALLSSTSPDWCTPESVLGLVREFAGAEGIGLDPCSCTGSIVNTRVEWRLERGEDGLERSWQGYGLVYANPPYGRALASWTIKIAQEAKLGVEIIALVPARTETNWFAKLWAVASAVCFWSGRIKFIGAPANAPFPSAVVYFGPRRFRFAAVFENAGRVVLP